MIGSKYVGGNKSCINYKTVDQMNLTLFLLNSSLYVKSNNYSLINNGSTLPSLSFCITFQDIKS